LLLMWSIDMKNDILEILQQHKLGHIPDEQALNELCVLFSVVWRGEQLSQCKCGNTVQVECDDCKDDRIRAEYEH
jgi:hypothetical protein